MRRECLTRLIVIGIAAVLAIGAQSVFAQLRIVGSVSGTVQDPSGAVVANARIVLKDEKTGLTKETTSTGGGTFLFSDLANGAYEVTVTMAGFRTSLVPHIAVSTSQTSDVRISLEVGQPTETVTGVTTDTQLLKTTYHFVASALPRATIVSRIR
jgi:hypothetical protein